MDAEANFTLGPVPMPYSVVDANEKEVALDDGQKQALEYVRFQPNGWLRDLHDCSALRIIAGRDCNGPSSTLLLSRESPVYLSAAFFDTSVFQHVDSMNRAQAQVPFEPSDRVTMRPCAGSEWCEGKDRFKWFMDIEPETGRLFQARVVFQVNARIGMGKGMPSMFNTSEALVPVAWEVIEQSANSEQLGQLLQAQTAPTVFSGLRRWFLAGGICLAVLFLAYGGCGVGVIYCQRQTGENADLTPKDKTHKDKSPLDNTEQRQAGMMSPDLPEPETEIV